MDEIQKKLGIIGKSKEMRDLTDIIMQVAPSDITVLIYGESGVGKEVIARAIHKASKRADKELLSLNCGAIPESLLESELFGHNKGSFTGAIESRKGYFELADNGTLFLDEIGEMPLSTQVKFLRVLETKEFMRIGAEKTTKVDVRLIAATNKNLQYLVDEKRFREDLYFRLKAVMLEIPPLRKRKQDIPELAEHFIKIYCENNQRPLVQLTTDALDLLYEYPWPGNVRELKNSVETAIALSRSDLLTADSFRNLLKTEERPASVNLPVRLNKTADEVERDFIYRALFELKKDIIELKDMVSKLSENGVFGAETAVHHHHSNGEERDELNLDKVEKEMIVRAMEKAGGNKRMAALYLNMSERTLYRKLEKLGL
ncbi:MAG: sigma-54 dependent transcriptional regulator [Ignavibacteriales bacterium]|nr:MAG: sigma-54-dependent Fis family transcriptional regulator [Ignavibacteriaceae bacterium]MBW7872483.1 sigma-54-dependent Fis family transcriptional regulator [Ignavibacteria bacterium]MCZ2141964.1 sigma-54 dependent transcriptional regulator [Ignavibacteriales bacterium]OQY72555.1 MAG: sigma-54-dependent Fis family transcriptional regulator [Ignavibacteriales bacterium UTCHB3]MBV6445130.1 Transcriptional regulatory protein ZraR [Ignavibacteriaceae bacterium]